MNTATIGYGGSAVRRICFHGIVLLTAAGFAAADGLASRPAKRFQVLHLDSYHHGSPWSKGLEKGLQNELLQGRSNVDLVVEYMDTKRISDAAHFARLADLYRHKFRGQPFDVIVASDNNALAFLSQYRDTLFPGTPVVFCGINNFSPAMLRGKEGYTGVAEAVDMAQTLRVALKLFPKTKRLFAFSDQTTTGQVTTELFRQAVKRVCPNLPCTLYTDLDMEELLRIVASLPRKTLLFRLAIHRDRHGRFLDELIETQRVCQAAHAPVFTFWENVMGTGILGGHVISAFRQGQEAGKLAGRILDGESVSEIPIVTESPNRLVFDAQVMKRFGLRRSDLPKDAHVLYEHPSFYQRHRKVLGVSAVTTGGLLLVIGFLLWNTLRRHRVEGALRESESRWRLLYEGLPGYTYTVNEQGVIENANDALCHLTGYARDELIGQPCSVLCTLSYSACPVAGNRLPRFVNVEGAIRTKAGREISILRSACKIPVGSRQVVIGNFQDISARKDAEKALQQSEGNERAFREKLTTLHEVLMALTAERHLDDLCRRTVSLARDRLGFERIGIWFNTDEPQIIAGSFGIDESGQLCDERERRLSVETDERLRTALIETAPTTFSRLYSLHNAEGQTVEFTPNAVATLWNGREVIGFLSVDSLLTGRKITVIQQRVLTLLAGTLSNLIVRLDMEKERARLAAAVEQAAEAIVITDNNGKIRYVNHALTQMLACSVEDVCEHDIASLYPSLRQSPAMEHMHSAMQSGHIWSDRMTAEKKQSEPLEVEVNLSPVRDAEGSVTHFIHILRDVSKETRLEGQLRQAAKMEAIGRLAGGIAHDFNNQLTVVRGYCDLLLRDLDPDDSTRECIEQIDHATRQATTLTSELLSFSRKQILKPQVVNPNHILQNIRKSLALIGEDIELVLELAKEVGHVRVDPNRLEQAVMNLAINARDAMPNGGKLTIRTTNVKREDVRAIPHHLTSDQSFVRISVQDTGVGMNIDTIEQVFEPFFSTKEKGKGTGLGLSMVYGFVQQSNGHVDVVSQPQGGTTFHLYLPQVERGIDAEAPLPETKPTQQRNETILVVEDDPSVRQLVVRVLQERGHEVLHTGVPAEAPDLIANLGRPLDLLVSDVVMPGTSGPSLARTLQEQLPGLRILFISGFTDQKRLCREIGLARVNFLQKPFSPQELCHAVANALR